MTSLKIVVCIKQVLNSDDVKINKETKNIDRTGAEMIINPSDLNAIELAISLKEKYGADTYVITMGIPAAEEALRECLAMGVDNAYLISDRALAGSDTIATTLTLAETIKKYVPGCDLVICGKHAIDSETSIVGPGIAERLNIPQLTYVEEVVEFVKGDSITVKRVVEEGDLVVQAHLPAMLSVTEEVNKPRYMNLNRIGFATNADIEMITAEKLGLSKEQIGQMGSPTIVGDMHIVETHSKGEMLQGDSSEMGRKIAEIIEGII